MPEYRQREIDGKMRNSSAANADSRSSRPDRVGGEI